MKAANLKKLMFKYLLEMKVILILTFMLFSAMAFPQDRIKTVSGEIINAKVTEVSKDEVKYKKSSNPDGPVYVLRKQEISSIVYQNGEKEVFTGERPSEITGSNAEPAPDPKMVELFYNMTRRNNRVYITGDNENAVSHAKNAINRWGYWIVTEKRYNADFILDFNVSFEGVEAYGSADFIYRNGKTIRSTPEVFANATNDLNMKRGLINKIVDEGIKPMFYK